jgi:S-adenosylmethionine hydrolase
VIKKIRESRKQLDFLRSKLDEEAHKELITFTDSIGNYLSKVEEALYQTKNQSRQDPLNYPIKLNNKLGHLMTLSSIGDYQPTEQAIAFKEEVFKEIDAAIEEFDRIREQMIPELNQMAREADIKAVTMD